MRIISRKKLREFAVVHPDAAAPLDAWFALVRKACWQGFGDVRRDYPSADQVGTHTVFNIGGNKYRLIAVVMYEVQRVYIRFMLTHKEYDKEAWKADRPNPRPKRPKTREDS